MHTNSSLVRELCMHYAIPRLKRSYSTDQNMAKYYTLGGNCPSISRMKLSIFFRPSSSTPAHSDHMTENRNHCSSIDSHTSMSEASTCRGRMGGGGGG